MKRIFTTAIMGLCLGLSSGAWGYDATLAGSYDQYFTPFKDRATLKQLQIMKVPDFMKAVLEKKGIVVLDIRTPAETEVVGFSLPGSLAIPMNFVFKRENLARIPTDKKVVVVCKTGHRAMAIATSLRHIGFKNVYVLANGLEGLSKGLSPKSAYPKPKKK